MVVYDITNENSFKSCSKWFQDIDQVGIEERHICMHLNESVPQITQHRATRRLRVRVKAQVIHSHCILGLVSSKK